MQELILKNNISESKLEALIYFLRSWDIEVEVKKNIEVSHEKETNFSLTAGLWEDYKIDADALREQAWHRNL